MEVNVLCVSFSTSLLLKLSAHNHVALLFVVSRATAVAVVLVRVNHVRAGVRLSIRASENGGGRGREENFSKHDVAKRKS